MLIEPLYIIVNRNHNCLMSFTGITSDMNLKFKMYYINKFKVSFTIVELTPSIPVTIRLSTNHQVLAWNLQQIIV